MPQSSGALWAFFIAAALGLTILVVALGAALVIAQLRFLRLHQAYGQHLLTKQDEERAWVAREVHDDVVQEIASFRYQLSLLAEDPHGLSEPQGIVLSGVTRALDQMGDQLRALARRLHPSTLDQGDLRLALEHLADEAARVLKLRVELDVPQQPPMETQDAALALYRVAQEALRNVARHAGVDAARLTVTTGEKGVVLCVEDRGRGFDLEAVASAARNRECGLGLVTIRERARLVGASATITSRPGAGTVVRVAFPRRENGAHG